MLVAIFLNCEYEYRIWIKMGTRGYVNIQHTIMV